MHCRSIAVALSLSFLSLSAWAQVKQLPGGGGDCPDGGCQVSIVDPTAADALAEVLAAEDKGEIAVMVNRDVLVDVRADVLRVLSAGGQVVFELPAAGIQAPVTIAGGATAALYTTKDKLHNIFDTNPGKGIFDTNPGKGIFDTNPGKGLIEASPEQRVVIDVGSAGIVIDVIGAGVVIDVTSAGLAVARTGGKVLWSSAAVGFVAPSFKGASVNVTSLRSYLTQISMPTLLKSTQISMPTLLQAVAAPIKSKTAISMPTLQAKSGASMPTVCMTGISYPTLQKAMGSQGTACVTGISYPTLSLTGISMPTLARVDMRNAGGKLRLRDTHTAVLNIRVGDELPSGIFRTTTVQVINGLSGKITIGSGDVALRLVGSHVETVIVGAPAMTKAKLAGDGARITLVGTVLDELKNFGIISSLRVIDSLLPQLFDEGLLRGYVIQEKGQQLPVDGPGTGL